MRILTNRTNAAGIDTRRFIIPSILAAACLAFSSAPVMAASAPEDEVLLAMSKNKRKVEENREAVRKDSVDTDTITPGPTDPASGPGSGTRTGLGIGTSGGGTGSGPGTGTGNIPGTGASPTP